MSIICNSLSYIYIHIPKTGGTSVARTLSDINIAGDLELGVTEIGEMHQAQYLSRFGVRKHSTYMEFLLSMGQRRIDEYFVFATVRHPITRVLSLYHFLKSHWRDWEGSEVMDSFDNLEEFLCSDLFQTNGPDYLLVSQLDYLQGADGEFAVDAIYKMEQLDDQWSSLILPSLGLPKHVYPTLNIPHLNTASGQLDVMLTPRSLEILMNRYGAEFDRLGYLTSGMEGLTAR